MQSTQSTAEHQLNIVSTCCSMKAKSTMNAVLGQNTVCMTKSAVSSRPSTHCCICVMPYVMKAKSTMNAVLGQNTVRMTKSAVKAELQLTVSICHRKGTAAGTTVASDTVSASRPVRWCSNPWGLPTGTSCRKQKDECLHLMIQYVFTLVNQIQK